MLPLQDGRLAEAAEIFAEVQGMVVLKSSWGGRASLQRALCLDSLSRTKEAQAIYKQITNHPEVPPPLIPIGAWADTACHPWLVCCM